MDSNLTRNKNNILDCLNSARGMASFIDDDTLRGAVDADIISLMNTLCAKINKFSREGAL